MMKSSSVLSGFFWKLLERFGVQFVQFILQLELAKLLDPEHYGELSLMVIFTNLATVFTQAGFASALIQKKDVTDEDYSSVFWLSLSITGVVYGILFFSAPLIAGFYRIPGLVLPFRILALMLLPAAFNSIQLAKVSRALNFRIVFFSNISSALVSGVIGIVIARLGGGLWALVAQHLINMLLSCIILFFTIRWRPKLQFNPQRIKVLFSYGWKLMISNLVDTLYQDLRSLVIGKKYDSGTLGYYNRGMQFPQFIINAVNGTVQSVMLPAMSANQDDKGRVKEMTRRSMRVFAYLITPMMVGLAVTAPALVEILLTEKWLPCVPYLQIACAALALQPINTCSLQAINAIGRSDVFLRVEILKKLLGTAILIAAVILFRSPILIAASFILTMLIGLLINAVPVKKQIAYSFGEQLADLLPSFGMAAVMGVAVYAVSLCSLPIWPTLLLQIALGVFLYAGLSVLFRPEPFRYIFSTAKSFFCKK